MSEEYVPLHWFWYDDDCYDDDWDDDWYDDEDDEDSWRIEREGKVMRNTTKFLLVLSREQRAALETAAERMNMKQSDFLRRALILYSATCGINVPDNVKPGGYRPRRAGPKGE